MRIYQAANGLWILWTGETKLYFDTESEAVIFMNKLDLAKAIVYRTQQLTETMDNGPDVTQWYFDSGVTFADSDVESLGLTATDIVNCITLLQQFANFMGNEAVTQALYRSTVNSVRGVNTS